jgi:hypothetical protein
MSNATGAHDPSVGDYAATSPFEWGGKASVGRRGIGRGELARDQPGVERALR